MTKSREADRILTIIELAAYRTRDNHREFAVLTPPPQWWETFAREIAALAAEWRRET